MSKILSIIALAVLLYSCGNSLDGRIETREGKVYLVNTSTSKEYEFTIKETIIVNDTVKNYKIHSVPVIAGGERFLGKKDSIKPLTYPSIEVVRIKTEKPKFNPNLPYEAVINDTLDLTEARNISSKKTNPFDGIAPPFISTHDTVINGVKTIYWYVKETIPDTLHPLPLVKYNYKYEITAQVVSKKETASN